MLATDGLALRLEQEETRWAEARPVPSDQPLDVVLKPVFRPDQPGLSEIRIDDAVLAIGRTEPLFASCGTNILSLLSRRHARIFREGGLVYLADLESRNGTAVNRAAVGPAPCQLRDGDEISFGGVLSYRAQIRPRTPALRPEGGLALTLTPDSPASGLDVIIVTRFPFLISKTDATFSRYKNEHGRELGYLSRRHAYIYLKKEDAGRVACIEDLASGNGTFVDGQRLQEHAVPLIEGARVAFGGGHFVYRVGITRPAGESTRDGVRKPVAEKAAAEIATTEPETGESDRTQFVAAPTSFLEIFCVTEAPADGAAAGEPALAADAAKGSAAKEAGVKEPTIKRRPRGRVMLLLSELASLFASNDPDSARRGWWKAATAAAVLGALAVTAYLWNATERDLQDAVARGEYARAATLAGLLLEKHPDDVDLKSQATEAALKANVPAWLAKLQARDFDGANGVLAGMSGPGARNSGLRPLIDELEWLGNLERLVADRGGPDAPIRIYADEDRIESLIGRWNDDTGEHQRALARIASYVPQFEDRYGEALTHLRRLQSESTVYLAVIERVKATIATELNRDNPEVLQPVLKETAEKYPRLGGLDSVRQDLARYIEIRSEARTRKSGRLFALLQRAHFETPPFQLSFRTLTASGQLPPADVLQQYDAATQAWKNGNPGESLAGLQKIAQGAWAEAAADEIDRRRGVTGRFLALQQARSGSGYVDQLLAFRESLDPDEDVYFVRATAADLEAQKDKVIARAQDAVNRARASWQEYRNDGAIDASQRIETAISDPFRTRARLLADASRHAQQGVLIYAQVDTARAAQWAEMRSEIETEARRQRGALQDLRNVLEPGLLNAKLALLGDSE
jgi:pSer/pThr/pTyr-binding forkhead associated (FHA) protein